jgi:hypothetical protein
MFDPSAYSRDPNTISADIQASGFYPIENLYSHFDMQKPTHPKIPTTSNNNTNNPNTNNSTYPIKSHYPSESILRLTMAAPRNSEYEFDQTDIHKTFSRFGEISKLLVQPQIAYIVFKDPKNAVYAQSTLNGWNLPNTGVELQVSWCSEEEFEQYLRRFARLRQSDMGVNNHELRESYKENKNDPMFANFAGKLTNPD